MITSSSDSQAIAGLMDRQRHDQQAMFRAFTNGMHLSLSLSICALIPSQFLEISGEIKGERLRFVEAMKEATAINVQSQFTYTSPFDNAMLTRPN